MTKYIIKSAEPVLVCFLLNYTHLQPTRSNCNHSWKIWHGSRSRPWQCKLHFSYSNVVPIELAIHIWQLIMHFLWMCKIIYARAYTYEHQYNLLLGLAAKMSEEPFRLLVRVFTERTKLCYRYYEVGRVDVCMNSSYFRSWIQWLLSFEWISQDEENWQSARLKLQKFLIMPIVYRNFGPSIFVPFLFSDMGQLLLQQKLAQMLSRLTKIAEEFNVAVYMTNQGNHWPAWETFCMLFCF